MWTRDRREDFKKDVAKEVTKFYLSQKEKKNQDARREVESIVTDEAIHTYRHKVKGRKYFYF